VPLPKKPTMGCAFPTKRDMAVPKSVMGHCRFSVRKKDGLAKRNPKRKEMQRLKRNPEEKESGWRKETPKGLYPIAGGVSPRTEYG
jgi:hypothetical protein